LFPQQRAVLFVVIAQVWFPPALICLMVPRFAGGVDCPDELYPPQHCALLFVVIAQV
jgi:hypothetical protein